ncbi:hypothetical protein Btru_068440 [Bulinus truncatus]|nr:hypothetical protein Btru_068440 [Bulinus truncatus]
MLTYPGTCSWLLSEPIYFYCFQCCLQQPTGKLQRRVGAAQRCQSIPLCHGYILEAVAWRRIGDKDDHFLTVGTFTWVRENNIQVDHKLEEGQVSRWNLIIKSVEKNDEGTYQCQITDKVPLRIHVYLTVKPRPAAKPAVTLTGKEYVDSNEPIRLICNATGGSKIPEDIDWFKDGTKLDSKNRRDPNIVLTKYMSLEDQALISELFIEHADINDSGSYICRSSDRELDSIKVTVLVGGYWLQPIVPDFLILRKWQLGMGWGGVGV